MVATLDARRAVLHGLLVSAGSSGIDHFMIRPGEALIINTKHRSRKKLWVAPHSSMVSGRKFPYIRKSVDEARPATTVLPAALTVGLSAAPTIVIVDDAKAITIARALVRWLHKRDLA